MILFIQSNLQLHLQFAHFIVIKKNLKKFSGAEKNKLHLELILQV